VVFFSLLRKGTPDRDRSEAKLAEAFDFVAAQVRCCTAPASRVPRQGPQTGPAPNDRLPDPSGPPLTPQHAPPAVPNPQLRGVQALPVTYIALDWHQLDKELGVEKLVEAFWSTLSAVAPQQVGGVLY
jgi:hypothetical protein